MLIICSLHIIKSEYEDCFKVWVVVIFLALVYSRREIIENAEAYACQSHIVE